MKKISKLYKYSVIIPIYNTDKYLEEAIESIIGQTISFKDNIEIILVNDGSTDQSSKICERYLKKYPDNIIYINQENKGVSQARNIGLKHSSGEYIIFLDSDDYLDHNIFMEVDKLVLKNKNQCDVIALNIRNFEGAEGSWHTKKYFSETKVIDLLETPEFIHLSCAASFIKGKVARNKEFSVNLSILEDAQYLYNIFKDNSKCGIINAKMSYWHRVRITNNSATQSIKDEKNILDLLKYLFINLIDVFINERSRELPDFVQNMFLTELNYYVIAKIPYTNYSANKKHSVIDMFKKIIMHIDTENIDKLSFLNNNDKRRYKYLKKYPTRLFDKDVYGPNGVDDSSDLQKKLKKTKKIILFIPLTIYKMFFGKILRHINKLDVRTVYQAEDIELLKKEIKILKENINDSKYQDKIKK